MTVGPTGLFSYRWLIIHFPSNLASLDLLVSADAPVTLDSISLMKFRMKIHSAFSNSLKEVVKFPQFESYSPSKLGLISVHISPRSHRGDPCVEFP